MELEDATKIVIAIFKETLKYLYEVMALPSGATVGWILTGIMLFGLLISTILSRPISGNIERFIPRSKKHEND